MIDLKHEIKRELSLIDPPDLWDRIQADASNNGDADVLDLTTARHQRRPSLWLAVAAVAALVALVGAMSLLDDEETVDTAPVTQPPSEDQSLADHAVLKGEDMTIGWVAASSDGGPRPGEDSLDRLFAECVDSEVTQLRNAGSTARSAFINSYDTNPEQIVSEVTVFASEEEVDDYLAPFRDEDVQACYLGILEQQIAEETRDGLTNWEGRALSGDEVELGESTLRSPVYWETVQPASGGVTSWSPVGEDRVAFHITVPLTAEGVDITVHHDFALIKQGRVAALTTFQTYDSSSDAGYWADRVRPTAPAFSAVADPAHALVTTKVIDRIAASAAG